MRAAPSIGTSGIVINRPSMESSGGRHGRPDDAHDAGGNGDLGPPAQRVTTLEVKMRKLSRSEVPKSIWEEHEHAPTIWRNARAPNGDAALNFPETGKHLQDVRHLYRAISRGVALFDMPGGIFLRHPSHRA